MRQYETVFLISPNLEEEETTKIITQISGIISKEKGKLIQEDRWGKKRLAYPIKKFEEAFYVFFHYEGDSNIPFELERRFKQTEAILRFLTVKKETRENVRKKRKGTPPEEETATPASEAEIVAPQEEKAELKKEEETVAPQDEEKVEKKEEEETVAPAKEEEIVVPQDEEKVEKKEEEAEKKEEEETVAPAKEEEIVVPQDEEKVEKKEEEAEKKEEEETVAPAKEEEIVAPQDEEKVEKKEEEAEKKEEDKEDLNSAEAIKEDK
jgi:small subunit ribosomal protein S6